MELQIKVPESHETQTKVLKNQLREALHKIGWLSENGKMKTSITFRKKHIKIENIKIIYGHWDKNKEVIVLSLSFDVHFQTEEEEAINHKHTFWACDVDDKYNINSLYKTLVRMDASIRSQLIFTDCIDMNLYTYYELDKKGWQIIKKRERKK